MEKDTTKALKIAAFSLVFMFVMAVAFFYFIFHFMGIWSWVQDILWYMMSVMAFVNIWFSFLAIFVDTAMKEIPDSGKLHKQVLVFILVVFIWLTLVFIGFDVYSMWESEAGAWVVLIFFPVLWAISLIWTGVVLYRVLRKKRVNEENKID